MAKLPETIEVKVTDLDGLKECEDFISRNNAITSMCQYGTSLERAGKLTIPICEMKQTVAGLLCSLPSVQSMRKRGKWINREIYGVTSPLLRGYECSLCGWTGQRIFKYCPMCGAGMFEDSE